MTNRQNIHKEEKKQDNEGVYKLRTRSVDRGGKYNNIQVTHIIYSKKNIDFHILEPTEITNLKPKYISNLGSTYLSQQDSTGKIKVSWKSSVDGKKFPTNIKKPNIGKTTIYYHCLELEQKKDSKKGNKKGIYQSRSATNITLKPRSNNYQQISYNTKRTFANKNDNNKQQNYNNKNNYNNINDKNNKNNSKYLKDIKISTKENNNYNNENNKNNYNLSNNNNQCSNYVNGNKKNIKDEENPSLKNSNFKNLIVPINLNQSKINKLYESKENIKKEDSEYKKNKSIEVNIVLEENNKPTYLKTNKINDKKPEINQINIQKIKEKENKIEIKPKKNFEKMFLLKNYFKIFKNKSAKSKEEQRESEYDKWFKRNCDNNNDVSKKNIININKYLYFYPKLRNDWDIKEQISYDEWFNRNCQKSENVLEGQKKENEKKNII